MTQRIKILPGAPWSEDYILNLLKGKTSCRTFEPYDIVIANGYEYTLDDCIQTERSLRILGGDDA